MRNHGKHGMFRRARPTSTRVFQPWPTHSPNALKSKRLSGNRRGVKRAFKSSFNSSLPVDPVETKIQRRSTKTDCNCCLKQENKNTSGLENTTIDLTQDHGEDMDLSMVNTTVATEASLLEGSALERPTSELSFSKGLEKSSHAGKFISMSTSKPGRKIKNYLASSTPARQTSVHNTSVGSSSTKRRLQLLVEDKLEKCKK